MTHTHVKVTSYEDAVARGFKPFDELSEELRAKVLAAKASQAKGFLPPISDCGPGHDPKAPCKDFCYKEGVHEVCFCSATNQCDDGCLYDDCPPY